MWACSRLELATSRLNPSIEAPQPLFQGASSRAKPCVTRLSTSHEAKEVKFGQDRWEVQGFQK